MENAGEHYECTQHCFKRQTVLWRQLPKYILVSSEARHMATCSFSEFAGGSCGSSSGNPANILCLTIGKCNKDITGHLKSYKVRDSALDTEARLLLARAGNYCCLSIY